MFTENAMPKIWFTDLPRAIFLRLGSLEIDRGIQIVSTKEAFTAEHLKMPSGARSPNWGVRRSPEVSWSGLLLGMDWLEAFGFFKTCQAITSKDAKIRPSVNFRGFVKGKYPVTMIVVAAQVIAVCPPRFMSWTACATFSRQGYLGAKARSPH